MMLASSWAQIYCLYIRLSSKKQKKKKREFSRKGWVLSDHLGDRNLPKGYTEYFIPDTSSPLECQPGSLMLRAAPAKHRPADGTNTLDGFHLCVNFCHTDPWPLFYKSELSNRRKEKTCAWGSHSDAVVIYQNIPIAQPTLWEPNKHPDKLQIVAKCYAVK